MRARILYTIAGIVMAILVALLVWQGSFSFGNLGPTTPEQTFIYWGISTLIFILTVLLGFILVRDSIKLYLQRRVNQEGSRIRTKLVVGVYTLCTQTPRTTWLNTCEWGGKGTTITLASPDASVPVSIVLTKGAVVNVRVNDASHLLATFEGRTSGAHLLMGVSLDGRHFRHATVSAQDSFGRIYQLTIPFDRALNLTVGSSFFQLADASSKPLPKLGTQLTILIPSGRAASTMGSEDLVLNLTGRY